MARTSLARENEEMRLLIFLAFVLSMLPIHGQVPKSEDDWIYSQLIQSGIEGFYDNYILLNSERHVPHELVAIHIKPRLVPGRIVVFERLGVLFQNSYRVKQDKRSVIFEKLNIKTSFELFADNAKKLIEAPRKVMKPGESEFESIEICILLSGKQVRKQILFPNDSVEMKWFIETFLYPK